MIHIDYEIDKVKQKLGSYSKKTPQVISRALNRAIASVKTNVYRNVKEDYYLKRKDIYETFTIRKASRNNLTARAKSKGGVIGLEKYKVTPSKARPGHPPRVLKVAVKRDGMKELTGAFVADINGMKVFTRLNKTRLPISRITGPAIPQIIDNMEIREDVQEIAVDTYNKRLKHEINRVLESGRK